MSINVTKTIATGTVNPVIHPPLLPFAVPAPGESVVVKANGRIGVAAGFRFQLLDDGWHGTVYVRFSSPGVVALPTKSVLPAKYPFVGRNRTHFGDC